MQNFFEALKEKLASFWGAISNSQRIVIVGLTALVTALFIGVLFWVNQPNYAPLYTNLTPEDANRVVTVLQADNVGYELADNGTTILVPSTQVYDLRVKIAGEGTVKGTGIGFEIFDEVQVGQTDFVQRINYQRALQGELGRTISEFPNVENARVHLVIPQRSLFIEEQQQPSASVVLKLKDASINMENKEVQGVVNMLTMSIEGLDKNRISITDSTGKSLYFPEEDSLVGISNTQREHKIRVEQGLERRIDELLTPILGPGKVIAKVNTELDYSQRTIRREIYDPDVSVIRSQQTSEETNRGQANADAGSPDVNFRGDGLTGTTTTQEGARETRSTNYEVNKEEQNIIGQVGEISRISVAVAVDGTYAKNEAGEYVYTPRTAEEMERIRLLVSSAVGFDRARGDTIEVSNVPFGEVELPESLNAAEVLAQYAERLGKPMLNALLVFLFLMLVVRPVILALIRPKVESGEIIEGLEGLPSADEQLALYEAQEEAARQAVLDAQLAEQAAAEAALYEEEEIAGFTIDEIKTHILQLADNNIEQCIIIMRKWMKNEDKALAR